MARWMLAALTLALIGPGVAAQGARAQASSQKIVELRLDGVVDPFIAGYIADEIEAANNQDADAVLLTIDTPGGLESSMRTIVQSILNSRIPVLCYVSPEGARAASAGTFILLSCSVAAMAPGTNVGAAHPVGVSGAIESDKAENDAAAFIRSIAEQRGHNPDWAEDAVRESVSISAEEALRLGVIDYIAPDVDSLLTDVDGHRVPVADGNRVVLDTASASTETSSPGIGTQVLHTLLGPDFAFIFFYLGLGLIVLELLHPGISVPGILGGLSLIASFASLGMLPFQIIGVALLLASAVFLILELQVPGTGIFTAGTVVTLVLGGLFLFDPGVPSARVSLWTIAPVALLLLLFLITVVPAARRVRRMPQIPQSARLLGRTGVVTEPLDPEGVVLVASESWTAISHSGPIAKEAHVRVTGIEGLTLTVEPELSEDSRAAREVKEGST